MSETGHRLEIRDLTIERGGITLYAGLNFTCETGQFKVIRGANGSGKSTLLQTIAGCYLPSKGEIVCDNVPITRHALYPQLFCYISHRQGLREGLSAQDHLTLWAKLAGNEALLDAAVHYFDLAPLMQMPVQALSAGWRQRVSLARLILSPAKIWLLDEPSSNLDARGSELLQSLIAVRLERGGIVIMASHAKIQGRDAQEVTTFQENA